MSSTYHVPVLLKESVEGLNINPQGIYVDATYGGGGHATAILKKMTTGKLLAFDQDEDAFQNIENLSENLIPVHANFSFLKNFVKLKGYTAVDGVLADLGVSSHQIDTPERGFSIRFDAELDLRMNQKNSLTAKEIVNTYSRDDLKRIFKSYGELNNAGQIARVIVENRTEKPFDTTMQLLTSLGKLTPKHTANKFFAKVFQALRIEVNNELEVLKSFLEQGNDLLKTGGRIAVISYHSLEDRLVKNFFKSGNFEGVVETDFFGNKLTPFKLVTKGAVCATEEEIKLNNRARSAKLRIAEKVN